MVISSGQIQMSQNVRLSKKVVQILNYQSQRTSN